VRPGTVITIALLLGALLLAATIQLFFQAR
jgi:Tfp pilus assembly protein PilW